MRKKQRENPIYPEKKAKKAREKFNWKPYIIILTVIALIFGSLLAKYYLFDGFFVLQNQVKFEYIRGTGYKNTETGEIFRSAPTYYEPASIVQEPIYGRIGGVNLFTPWKWDEIVHLYELCYPIGEGDQKSYAKSDPSIWLATDEEHGSVVYYNESFNFPEPQDFAFETMYLCDADGRIATHELDSMATASLMNAFFDENSENLFSTSPIVFEETPIKSVRVTSSVYKWLHMVLYLYQYEDAFYLYIPELRRFVQTDSEIFGIYFTTSDDLMGSSK